MTKRGSGPALYEVIHSRAPVRAAAPEPARPTPPPMAAGTGHDWAWLSPGRMLRVPVGYVLVSVAGVIVLLVLAHMVGYERGARSAMADAQAAEEQRLEIMDPSRSETAIGSTLTSSPPLSVASSSGRSSGPQRSDLAKPAAGTSGSLPDPREPGLNYFVLMQTNPDGAARFVDFCRAEGLDAWAVRVNNSDSQKVVVRPGYAAGGERSSPKIKALEQRIVAVQAKWRTQTRTKEALGYYPEKYERP